jgi:hypothetical protein
MKKIIVLLILSILVILNSCNPLGNFSLKPITELYDGRISIEKGIRASSSQGKENYLTLTIEEDKFVATGWVSPVAIANNCAILFIKANPQSFDKIDLLEIEITNVTSSTFKYRKKDLYSKSAGYNKVEKKLEDFINLIEANKIDEATRFMKSDSNNNMSKWASFLKTVKSIFPAKYKGTKLIGYRTDPQPEIIYEIDFVVISQDDVQRMLKATLEEDKNGLTFRSITI